MFYRLLNLFFKIFVYSGYRVKYNLPSDFRFNGFLIRFNVKGDVFFGSRCYISYYSYLNVPKGTKLVVGDDVSIGHNVKIYTSSFDIEMKIKNKISEPKNSSVYIGNNVLIGANVFICPGVCIGDNVVIGANSVVTHDIVDSCSAAGAPAKVIRKFTL
ncbi:acyltransferase [Marinomonas ostreistagni]|uniref:acyltransferase n=1 Tax=Marinomonas ostreistagni TaxID=359209 RepID=UPI0019515514|nr:acyltransferase [Marinomonas ostreistagni]MBM6551059.1 acyltransferase [Marinomonas ostreistagni]